ncbi:MAG: hypothetical protein QXW94_02835, partial [Desulfurococcaceae archaeon]
MNTRLFIVGVDVVIISALLALYGLATGDQGLVGIGTSIGVAGSVLVAYSTTPKEPVLGAVLSYTSMLAHAVTAVAEDLDLLNSRVCAHNTPSLALISFSKSKCPNNPNPGIGLAEGSPYISIPVSVFQEVGELEERSAQHFEESLNSLLVDELGVCSAVRVEQRGDLFIVDLLGISKLLAEYSKYPVDPAALLLLAITAKIMGECRVHLVEKES